MVYGPLWSVSSKVLLFRGWVCTRIALVLRSALSITQHQFYSYSLLKLEHVWNEQERRFYIPDHQEAYCKCLSTYVEGRYWADTFVKKKKMKASAGGGAKGKLWKMGRIWPGGKEWGERGEGEETWMVGWSSLWKGVKHTEPRLVDSE